MFCWGDNTSGQLGFDPTLTPSVASPQFVTTSPTIDPTTVLSAGDSFTCMMFSDWTIRCMGHNTKGQLGNGSLTDSFTPTDVLNLTAPVVNEYLAHPIYVSLKVLGIYQPFALAPMCVDTDAGHGTGTLAGVAATAAGFCVDVYAISRDPVTGAISYPVLFVEDPTATPLSKKA